MPTRKKKRHQNKKMYSRKRSGTKRSGTKRSGTKKHGGQVIKIGRLTNKDNKYLDTQISRSIENTGNIFEPYIEPGFNLDVKPHEAKYANDILSSKLDKSDIKVSNVNVRVTSFQEEEQAKLYKFLVDDRTEISTDTKEDNNDVFLNKYFKDNDERKELFTRMTAWQKIPVDKDGKKVVTEENKNNFIKEKKAVFPKYFKENPASIPQRIDELKDDIYPLITDKIVEHFMDQVPEKDRPSIYVKGDNSTYNNIRYVIMHILSDIFFI